MEHIKSLKEMEELMEVVKVQKKAWQWEDLDLLPFHVFKDASGFMSPNGIVLGYFIDDKLVGYILTFPTSNPREILLEMVAVLPDYQGRGIGYKLSLELRRKMLELNINKIIWTYDPLDSINANLYVRKLGGLITRHFIDYYGPLEVKIHSSIPTDRFKVEWNIGKEWVYNKIQKVDSKIKDVEQYDKDVKYVEIPLNFKNLKDDITQAIDLRMKTRKLFEEYIEDQNYIGIDFFMDGQRGIYVFKRIDTIKNFPLYDIIYGDIK